MNETAGMADRPVKLLYFAWLRERVGTGEESLTLPASVDSVPALLDHLASLSDGHAHALEARDVVRVALDKKVAAPDAPLGEANEIALFPPMTGG